jgi:hypothetical protein
MILHAIHAEKAFGESGIKGRIIVKSPDTHFLIRLLWNWAISGLITYPAGFVRVLETHELNKF